MIFVNHNIIPLYFHFLLIPILIKNDPIRKILIFTFSYAIRNTILNVFQFCIFVKERSGREWLTTGFFYNVPNEKDC